MFMLEHGFYADPLAFVLAAYPWEVPNGPLAAHDGPDRWQAEFLTWVGDQVRARAFDGHTPVLPIRRAVSKGHGVGGTVLAAWLVHWILSTRPHSRGTVTANTNDQLETKTWATIRRWTPWCLTAPWFEVNSARLYHKDFPASWFCTPQTCREENSEAFAGQHAEDATSFFIFDEASAVPNLIYEVAEGGLTDGEPMAFLFGNPTRSSGKFHEACFGARRDRWSPVILDARTCRFPNPAQIAEWIADYGEDSDFVRVRVRGLPPRASSLQFIDQDRVWAAQRRPVPVVLPDEPLVAGVDVSGGGEAWNVIRFRQGLNARFPAIRIPGEVTRQDRSAFLAQLAELLTKGHHGHPVAMLFIDTAFGAPYAERLHQMGFKHVVEINFGAKAIDPHQANQRAYMWNRMKDWLVSGAIDPTDTKLELDLTAPGYHLNRQDQLVLEPKESLQKRGVASPDDADALCLTWGAPVLPVVTRPALPPPARHGADAWMAT